MNTFLVSKMLQKRASGLLQVLGFTGDGLNLLATAVLVGTLGVGAAGGYMAGKLTAPRITDETNVHRDLRNANLSRLVALAQAKLLRLDRNRQLNSQIKKSVYGIV